MSSLSISSTFSTSSSASTISRGSRGGGRRGGYGFVSILIVVLLSLLSSWQEHGVVSALQIVQRLSSPSFPHHHQSSRAIVSAASPSLSSLWVPSSQDDEANQSIDSLLSSSSFDVYSISGGFNNLEEESFDPVRLTRFCDDDRSHSQRSTRIIQ